MTQLSADFEAESWSETKAEQEQSVVISNLPNFFEQHRGNVIEPPREYKIIGDDWVFGVIHEDDTTAAMLVQVFDQFRNPRRPNAFPPTVNNDRKISGRVTAMRSEVSVERRDLHFSGAGDEKKTSMLEMSERNVEATHLLLKTVKVIDCSYSFKVTFMPSEDAKITRKTILIIPTAVFTLKTVWQLIVWAFSQKLMFTKAFTEWESF